MLAGLTKLRDDCSEVRMSGVTKVKGLKVANEELKKAVWT